jgi:hypothetical protein
LTSSAQVSHSAVDIDSDDFDAMDSELDDGTAPDGHSSESVTLMTDQAELQDQAQPEATEGQLQLAIAKESLPQLTAASMGVRPPLQESEL